MLARRNVQLKRTNVDAYIERFDNCDAHLAANYPTIKVGLTYHHRHRPLSPALPFNFDSRVFRTWTSNLMASFYQVVQVVRQTKKDFELIHAHLHRAEVDQLWDESWSTIVSAIGPNFLPTVSNQLLQKRPAPFTSMPGTPLQNAQAQKNRSDISPFQNQIESIFENHESNLSSGTVVDPQWHPSNTASRYPERHSKPSRSPGLLRPEPANKSMRDLGMSLYLAAGSGVTQEVASNSNGYPGPRQFAQAVLGDPDEFAKLPVDEKPTWRDGRPMTLEFIFATRAKLLELILRNEG